MAQVIPIGQPANDAERQVIAVLRDGLPADYRIVHNFELRGDGGQWFEAEQAGTGQPATRPESKSEGGDKPQPESEGRSR